MWTRMISSNVLDLEAEFGRALALQAVRPAGDDAHHEFVGLGHARRDLVAGDPAQRLDLLADRAAHAGHGEIDVRLDLSRAAAPHRG